MLNSKREMAAKKAEAVTMKQLIIELDQRISSLSGSGKLNDNVKNIINPIVERVENMYRKAVKSLPGDKRREFKLELLKETSRLLENESLLPETSNDVLNHRCENAYLYIKRLSAPSVIGMPFGLEKLHR
ncbi:hypothetical protein [Coxiella endosymbiont of Ornithodoros amblus]|uniref:hypothetical protein n=1 Tax=Coxiella endosymbiont of Ornithodoros amblus TaxID=1656166 RepID=UPI00244DD881|nr:hypothetical protein [Coxiella endosymbiont of Ornithodoros amblus]